MNNNIFSFSIPLFFLPACLPSCQSCLAFIFCGLCCPYAFFCLPRLSVRLSVPVSVPLSVCVNKFACNKMLGGSFQLEVFAPFVLLRIFHFMCIKFVCHKFSMTAFCGQWGVALWVGVAKQ